MGRVGNFRIARFVRAALTARRAGGIDSISFHAGAPRVVMNASSWFVRPSLVVLRGASSPPARVEELEIKFAPGGESRDRTCVRSGRQAADAFCVGWSVAGGVWAVIVHQAEWAALGVFADRPLCSGMDDAAAECPDLPERGIEIADREIRERERISGPAPPAVHADDRILSPRLPAVPIGLATRLQVCAEELRPEAPSAIRVVGRELDQG